MKVRTRTNPLRRRRRLAVVGLLAATALVMSACGSRLTSSQQAEARGSASNGVAAGDNGITSSGDSNDTTTTLANGATTTTVAGSSGNSPTGSTGPVTGGGTTPTTAAGASSGPCGPSGNQTPSGGNGGATATGVTATTITVGNIASISGVAPGLTQSAQQATEAWAAYVNSQGGICGRQIKVQPFDDGNDSGTDYSDAAQACTSDFAMVGNASGFDDGSAQAVGSCGIPDMASEVSTAAAGTTADIFGASPGNAHYWSLGPANYIKATYPNAIQHAAMIYLNVSATQTQAQHEVAAYESVGFKYVYDTSTTPTNANYAANVQAMQSAGAEYVTEYSDADSAERLLEAMQQANYTPQVVDWFSEEYSPQFAQQTEPESNGDLVLMSATVGYSDAAENPELQLFESWMNRVAPGYHQDIFAILAWSAGLAFEQAAKQVGPDLTRPALISAIQGITNWTGDGITPPVNIGGKIPSKCFFYEKIENGSFQRVYPTAPNTFDCNSGYFQY
ncbi:MAG TPA: ABC transporter substrate-binding protein [Acidimicrobiales bacterium]|jgi:ABC-type branched-subunit amino acid transport system substrate-binding protein